MFAVETEETGFGIQTIVPEQNANDGNVGRLIVISLQVASVTDG